MSLNHILKMEGCEDTILRTMSEYFEDDDMYNHTGANDTPPVQRILSVNGTGVPTPLSFALRLNTRRLSSIESQAQFVLDDEATPALGRVDRESGIIKESTGDGTVPHASSGHASTWNRHLQHKIVTIEGAEHREMLNDSRLHDVIVAATAHHSNEASCGGLGPWGEALHLSKPEHSFVRSCLDAVCCVTK
eukprot:TRINITY_DN41123_c0_g1_i1.p1 TRINITY_DN41123_c0_g1~~TRINITY_DN41123_c0_g1_i1.p1  ORF type:complete len:191 (-),score=17.16 TRINITY_DN41123_c0_g1_i1:326-898(-)